MFEVNILTTNNRPMNAQEWAKLATDKIIYVGNQTDGPIRDQALAYKQQIENVISYYIEKAVQSHEQHLLTRK
jgi:hypothetical protein